MKICTFKLHLTQLLLAETVPIAHALFQNLGDLLPTAVDGLKQVPNEV